MSATAKNIAALERQLKETKNNKVRSEINAKLIKLRESLSHEQKSQLPAERKKMDSRSATSFKDFIAELKEKPEYVFLKGMSSKKIKDDLRVTGKPVGWRFKGRGDYRVPSKKMRKDHPDDVYFEDRANRSDVVRRNRLEKGGKLSDAAARARVAAMTDDEVREELDTYLGIMESRTQFAHANATLNGIDARGARVELIKCYHRDFEDVEEQAFADGGNIGVGKDVEIVAAEKIGNKDVNANFIFPQHRKPSTIGVRLKKGGELPPSESDVDAAIKKFESKGYEVTMRLFGGWRAEKGGESRKLSDAEIVKQSRSL